eukprot:TRINITY_DN2655_c0_g1_i1.p1 TRINITY_DN2655_c0_g1~~TRINITY_DN2655_c0_g1_i1.p1  ORF type:complete len:604 (-),score=59.74 TRINITY_DN2655_c0_g1_i1:255-2003(-)
MNINRTRCSHFYQDSQQGVTQRQGNKFQKSFRNSKVQKKIKFRESNENNKKNSCNNDNSHNNDYQYDIRENIHFDYVNSLIRLKKTEEIHQKMQILRGIPFFRHVVAIAFEQQVGTKKEIVRLTDKALLELIYFNPFLLKQKNKDLRALVEKMKQERTTREEWYKFCQFIVAQKHKIRIRREIHAEKLYKIPSHFGRTVGTLVESVADLQATYYLDGHTFIPVHRIVSNHCDLVQGDNKYMYNTFTVDVAVRMSRMLYMLMREMCEIMPDAAVILTDAMRIKQDRIYNPILVFVYLVKFAGISAEEFEEIALAEEVAKGMGRRENLLENLNWDQLELLMQQVQFFTSINKKQLINLQLLKLGVWDREAYKKHRLNFQKYVQNNWDGEQKQQISQQLDIVVEKELQQINYFQNYQYLKQDLQQIYEKNIKIENGELSHNLQQKENLKQKIKQLNILSPKQKEQLEQQKKEQLFEQYHKDDIFVVRPNQEQELNLEDQSEYNSNQFDKEFFKKELIQNTKRSKVTRKKRLKLEKMAQQRKWTFKFGDENVFEESILSQMMPQIQSTQLNDQLNQQNLNDVKTTS